MTAALLNVAGSFLVIVALGLAMYRLGRSAGYEDGYADGHDDGLEGFADAAKLAYDGGRRSGMIDALPVACGIVQLGGVSEQDAKTLATERISRHYAAQLKAAQGRVQ